MFKIRFINFRSQILNRNMPEGLIRIYLFKLFNEDLLSGEAIYCFE